MKGHRPHFGVRAASIVLVILARAVTRAAELAAPDPGARDVADMDLDELVKVRVSPFEVTTRLDRGYRASNSVSGSRLDTAIRELPFAIQAFTEAFIEDQKPRTLFDVVRYSPGVTYRSNDFNEGSLEPTGKNLTDARYRPSQSTRSRPRELFITVKAQL
jgi:iron complex outermembrane receptor protein